MCVCVCVCVHAHVHAYAFYDTLISLNMHSLYNLKVKYSFIFIIYFK